MYAAAVLVLAPVRHPRVQQRDDHADQRMPQGEGEQDTASETALVTMPGQ